jgi:predicted RNA-binding Zn ribbon-like protein
MLDVSDSLPQLADPQLAIDLLITIRHSGDKLVDQLRDPAQARAWLETHFDPKLARAARPEIPGLIELRDQMRTLFAAIVDGRIPPASAVAALSEVAARAPVTLKARRSHDGALSIERTTLDAPASSVLQGECARAALALLTDDLRDRLMLCRAPNCILFFLKQHPLQQWCSPSCGNRARVARHYARHRHTP